MSCFIMPSTLNTVPSSPPLPSLSPPFLYIPFPSPSPFPLFLLLNELGICFVLLWVVISADNNCIYCTFTYLMDMALLYLWDRTSLPQKGDGTICFDVGRWEPFSSCPIKPRAGLYLYCLLYLFSTSPNFFLCFSQPPDITSPTRLLEGSVSHLV